MNVVGSLFWTGIAAEIIGLGLLYVKLPYYFEGQKAEGRVTELRKTYTRGRWNRHHDMIAPVVSYVAKGRPHTMVGYGMSHSSYRVGDRVEVVYLASSPKSALINDFSQVWLIPCLAIFGGIGFLGTAIALHYLYRRDAEAVVSDHLEAATPGQTPLQTENAMRG